MNPNAAMPESRGAGGEHSDFAGALFDCMACGIIGVCSSRQITAFNATAERLIGLPARDILGQPIDALPSALRAIIEETLAQGQNITTRRVGWPGLKGRQIRVTAEVASQGGSKIHSVLLQLQDLELAQEIAAHLKHLDQLANIGVLGAGAAHEIRNALVAVRTFAGLLQERHKDDELTHLVSSEIARIDTVVRQLLHGATRNSFILAPLSLHSIVKDSVSLLRHEFQSRSITLEVSLGAAIDQVNGDERQLRHALLNLLLNAFEASNGTGRLAISTDNVTTAGVSQLRLVISDTGGGIHPDHLPRIFDPFFTTKKEGTGLGLAITRNIIEEHKGSIRVQSRLGAGAKFELLLPVL